MCLFLENPSIIIVWEWGVHCQECYTGNAIVYRDANYSNLVIIVVCHFSIFTVS